MTAPEGNCDLHITIRQTFTAPWPASERCYTIAELADLWQVKPKTLYNWLALLRRSEHAPRPGQLVRRRVNRRFRPLEIRADYVRLMAQLFREAPIQPLRFGMQISRSECPVPLPRTTS